MSENPVHGGAELSPENNSGRLFLDVGVAWVVNRLVSGMGASISWLLGALLVLWVAERLRQGYDPEERNLRDLTLALVLLLPLSQWQAAAGTSVWALLLHQGVALALSLRAERAIAEKRGVSPVYGLVAVPYIALGVLSFLMPAAWLQYVAVALLLVPVLQLHRLSKGGSSPVLSIGKVLGRITLTLCYCILCGVVVYFGAMQGNNISLEAAAVTQQTHSETRDALEALGVPDYVLADLNDEALALLADTQLVLERRETGVMYDSGEGGRIRQLWEVFLNRAFAMDLTRLYLKNEEGQVYQLYYFEVRQGSAQLQDVIFVTADWQETPYPDPQTLLGALLYTQDGQNYSAPLPGLHGRFGYGGWPAWSGAALEADGISAQVSFPKNAENQRGYLLFDSLPLERDSEEAYGTEFWYMHMCNPLEQYPLADRTELFRRGGWEKNERGIVFSPPLSPLWAETEPILPSDFFPTTD